MLKPLALLLSALALLAAGCGGDGGGGGGAVGTQGTAAAELLGPDTFLYAAIDTDLESSQWQQVDDLLQKFPGREKLLQEIRDSLADDGVDYESEVAPALGEALYLVVSEVPPKGEDVPFYALHKPKDADKFEALLRAGDDPEDVPEFKVLDDGWYAIADSREVLDSVRLVEEGDTLASDERFTQAMDGLADDAIAKVYVSGEDAGEALREYGGAAGVTLQQFGYERFDSFAAALSAEDDGVRVEGAVRGKRTAENESAGQPFESKLVPEIPSGALAVISARGTEGTKQALDDARSSPSGREGLETIEKLIGVDLDELLPLFEHEIAIYARPGAPIPELTLLLETPDETRALTTVDRLASRLAGAVGSRVTESERDGVTVKTVTIQGFAVNYAAFDGRLVLTTSRNGIRDLRSDGDKLADDSDFADAREAAGMPEETGGFLYVNLQDAIPLAEDFAGLSDNAVPAEVSENLEPLRSFLTWADADGERTSFTAFLGVE